MGDAMFTYILIAIAAVFVVAVVVHEARSWRRPGRYITQNAPMDDANNSWAKWQHDSRTSSQISGGGPG